MAKQVVYDINSPDGIGMFMDRVFSTPQNAQIGFEEWKKNYEYQGYYSDNRRNQIPLNELRNHCRLVDFEIDTDEFDGEIV